MKIKLCGFTDLNSAEVAVAEKCDFLGFVFCDKSPRNISISSATIITKSLPKTVAKVAVVSDLNHNEIEKIANELTLDFFQFHGNESVSFLTKFHQKFPAIKIIKAFKIKEKNDLKAIKKFENIADIFLFDSCAAGSGKSFDWKILQNFSSKKPWFLSGGLNINNIEEAIKITGATMIDISSGIEKIHGKKSPKMITELMIKIRKNFSHVI
jgi:phosphoribosylanthranilate isomerase